MVLQWFFWGPNGAHEKPHPTRFGGRGEVWPQLRFMAKSTFYGTMVNYLELLE